MTKLLWPIHEPIKPFETAMANRYTDQHWSIIYSAPQGSYHIKNRIFVGFDVYRRVMAQDGFALCGGTARGERSCEFWVKKEEKT